MWKIFTIIFLSLFAVIACCSQSKPTLDTAKLKAIEVSTPATLPQEPVVPKEHSDAQDEGLKGKVKSVTRESQDLSGTGRGDSRRFSYIENYNEIGNLVKRISFDHMSDPSDITVYGYLNGVRVSKTKTITHEYDPPAPITPPGAAKSDQNQREVRITYGYGYKYSKGRLAEMQMYRNDKTLGMRYTYTVSGNTLEKLAYDDKGELNQKYIYKLDEKGNEIEDIRIDLTPQKYYGDKKFVFKYESFDGKGNWTKRTASQIVIENGNEIVKPAFIHFRTINYFE